MKPPVVLVVRGDDAFSSTLRNGGYEVLNLELIATAPADDLSELEAKLLRLDDYDGLFFTSPVAAQVFAERSRSAGISFRGKIYVLGERAKAVLENAGYDVVFADHANTAEEMIAALGKTGFTGKRLLFLRGDRSMRTIPTMLADNATVDEVVVYEIKEARHDESFVSGFRERLKRGEIDWVCFFSPSGVEEFRELFPSDLVGLKAAAIGETTAGRARELDLKVDFISPRATAEDFAVGLIGHIKNVE